jgi:hypothetical protein
MKRLVRVIARDGAAYEVPMRAEEAAFFLQLAELEARTDPTITFHDVVANWIEKQVRGGEDRSDLSKLAN